MATTTTTATATATAVAAAASEVSAKVCEVGGSGLLLPFIPKENEWDKTGRAFGYLMALLWCFLGVSIVADIFMGAIEAVTSKRVEKTLSTGRKLPIKWWNPTVANLTLMALGSSAPEILLSIIELLGNDFYSGELGPGTIVGSAAFNLLVIIAVCVIVIPDGGKRTIAQPTVFLITASFSVFAYLWLIIILALSTPDMVEVWEGVLSFLFFPILVVIAWLADKGIIGPKRKDLEQDKLDEMRVQLVDKVRSVGPAQDLNAEDLQVINQALAGDEQKSRAERRQQVTKGTMQAPKRKVLERDVLTIGFLSSAYCFADDEAKVTIEVEKTGFAADRSCVEVKYCAIDRQGNAGEPRSTLIDAHHVRGKIECEVPKVLDDPTQANTKKNGAAEGDLEQGLEDRYFWVQLLSASYRKEPSQRKSFSEEQGNDFHTTSKLKDGSLVHIPDDRTRAQAFVQPKEKMQKGAGQIRFPRAQVEHRPSADESTELLLTVNRFNGHQGELKCWVYTQADTARAGYDYTEIKRRELVFSDSSTVQTVNIPIAKKGSWESQDKFLVFLEDIDEDKPVVVKDACTCTVTIAESSEDSAKMAKVMRKLDGAFNFDSLAEGNTKWKEQFINAFRPVAGDDEDAEEAGAADWAIHFVALPWKIFFAFIPPVSYCGGKLAFGIALVFIGVVTALIGDLASLMGCCMGLPDSITAITIVALGTSLPDTFASKVAAVEDSTADAAIGNVTGSNSVNVFLGLGLPWMIASIYWNIKGATPEWQAKYSSDITSKYPDGGFIVMAGDLTFGVIVFTIATLIALSVIGYRRYAFKAELGGPQGVKINTAVLFVLLWFFYIALASWKTLTPDAAMSMQVVAIIAGLGGVTVGMVVISLAVSLLSGVRKGQDKRAQENLTLALQEHSKLQQQQTGVLGGGVGHQLSTATVATAFAGKAVPQDLAQCVAGLRSHLDGLSGICSTLESAVQAQARAQATRKSKPGTE